MSSMARNRSYRHEPFRSFKVFLADEAPAIVRLAVVTIVVAFRSKLPPTSITVCARVGCEVRVLIIGLVIVAHMLDSAQTVRVRVGDVPHAALTLANFVLVENLMEHAPQTKT